MSGPICIATTPEEALEKVTPGCVLVVRQITEDYRPVLDKVGALISESGMLVADGNSLAVDYNLPCVIRVMDAFATLADGDIVTVDGTKGLIYRGKVRLVI